MPGFFISETKRIKAFLFEERLSAAVLSFSTLFLILSRIFPTSPEILGTLLYYLILPLLVVTLILHRNPIDFGLGAGLWRVWLPHVAVACVLAILLALSAARIPAFREFYGGTRGPAAGRIGLVMIDLLAVEFMFRGFVLFGLKERFGGGAVLVQMVPFALFHLHKPGLEAAGCVLSGVYFGYLAWRTDSLWPVYIIHCFAALAIVLLT
ncbi:MAG: CPBP family intramembrane metalloprotease [Candidatus Krumholzibacteriota bacterium]|nr:CPBP family intramembrane metalloprotease [Candidatus Krumholzibacteriota bacterium]